MTITVTHFKRIEQKYLLTFQEKDALLALLEQDIFPDNNGNCKWEYALESCYYDTENLDFYKEKIEWKEFRKKIRIRRYVDHNVDFSENSEVFLEIKERRGEITEKRRIKIPYKDAKNFLEKNILPNFSEENREIIEEIAEITKKYALFPQTITTYNRQAFFGKDSQIGLRLTFDTTVNYKSSEKNLWKNSYSDGEIIESDLTILELKVFGSFPEKILNFFEKNNIIPIRMSKYATSIENSWKYTALNK